VKGLEANLIWTLVLAVVSITLLIMLITGTLQPAIYRIYCDVYLQIVSFFSHVETSSMPYYCKPYGVDRPEVVEIQDQDNVIVSRKILAYIIKCWQEVEIKQLYRTHTCYELDLMKPVSDVTENDVNTRLVKEDLCKSIENSDFGCGVRDQIIWDVGGGVINTQKIILIEYNNVTDAIRVIG